MQNLLLILYKKGNFLKQPLSIKDTDSFNLVEKEQTVLKADRTAQLESSGSNLLWDLHAEISHPPFIAAFPQFKNATKFRIFLLLWQKADASLHIFFLLLNPR